MIYVLKCICFTVWLLYLLNNFVFNIIFDYCLPLKLTCKDTFKIISGFKVKVQSIGIKFTLKWFIKSINPKFQYKKLIKIYFNGKFTFVNSNKLSDQIKLKAFFSQFTLFSTLSNSKFFITLTFCIMRAVFFSCKYIKHFKG